MKPAIIAITTNGARLAGILHRALPESSLFVIDKHACGEALPFSNGVPSLVERLWPIYDCLVFIMATGIVVRTVAPLLQAKDKDPAVVVVDDTGRFAISLLSGHLGGANELATRCSAILGGTAVITTATDANGLPSFDMLAKEQGWVIEDLSRVKVLNALLLEGKKIAVLDHRDVVRTYCGGRGNISYRDSLDELASCMASGRLLVTNRLIPPEMDPLALVLRPVNLYLGIGCNRGTTSEEIEYVVKKHIDHLSLSHKSVKCIATAEAKRDEAGLLEFAKHSGLEIRFYGSERLNDVEVPSPPSEHAFAAIGATGVAEPAALLASGGGTLLLKKVKDGNVTLAIAEAV